ncbi:uncharacterized protein LOC122612254 [Drosophila teissieri]|uniref:uncharacterized protein LOC122612254 n=1 Tax=Drosophila teissieri TaxID=7243 RepID=UPI001CBA4B89|nr:uncharacterized protein LOC122612254 [Drosophila teissieri]
MGSRFFLRNFILFGLLASSNMQIPVGELENSLDSEMPYLLEVTYFLGTIFGLQSVTIFSGCINISHTIQRSLMDRYIPVNTVGSNLQPAKYHKLANANIRIVLFSGLDDPIFSTLNATKSRYSDNMYILVYATPNTNKSVEMDFIEEVFALLWNMSIDCTFLMVHGEFKMEIWNYFYLEKIQKFKVVRSNTFLESIRNSNFKFVLHVIDDSPSLFWYNSSEQADVTGGGNISVSGPIGLFIINFMRHLNMTTEIVPVPGRQTSKYENYQHTDNFKFGNATYIVGTAVLKYSPMVLHSRTCLLVANHRMVPLSRFLDRLISPGVFRLTFLSSVGVFVIKFFSHRPRLFLVALFGTFRFFFGIPLPNNVLERLPMVDRWIEVFIFLLVNILLSSNISITSSALTTGFYETPIRNVETMRASGLQIMTADPTIPQAFKDNFMPSSLADLVVLVDEPTYLHHVITLNNSYVYVVQSHNWEVFRLYQQQMTKHQFEIGGEELCSKWRILGLPLNPKSPFRFMLNNFFYRVIESGLGKRWLHVGFKKFCDVNNLNKLPVDSTIWKPLSIEFFSNFIRVYILGLVLATLTFVGELVQNRYRRRN